MWCSKPFGIGVDVRLIYFLCGAGGSGKDTLASDILKDIKWIERGVLYTNRPKREGEINDVTYHFVSIDDIRHMINNEMALEYRVYTTLSDEPWYYLTGKDLLDSSKDFLLWGPYNMYMNIKATAGNMCKGIFINVPILERLHRMTDRVSEEKDIAEACRRIYSDYNDFKCIDIFDFDKVTVNLDGKYDETLDDIKRYIEKSR